MRRIHWFPWDRSAVLSNMPSKMRSQFTREIKVWEISFEL